MGKYLINFLNTKGGNRGARQNVENS